MGYYKKAPSIKHQNIVRAYNKLKALRRKKAEDFFASLDPRLVEVWEASMRKLYGPEIPYHERSNFMKNAKIQANETE